MFNRESPADLSETGVGRDRGAIVVLTALLSRLLLIIFALLHFGPGWFFSRGSEMGFLADSLLRGRGFSSPFGVPTGPTAIVAPGYPLLVSLVFRLMGSYTSASALLLMLIGGACNVLTVYLIYRLGRLISSERSAFFASLFWACSVPLVWMPTIFWETNLSALCLIGILYRFASRGSMETTTFWLICGVLCGAAALFNPALAPSLTLLVIYKICRGAVRVTRWRCLLVWVAGALFVYSPWPLRNARVFHACVLTRTTVGLELWMGNHPDATGYLQTSLFPTYNESELADYQERGEIGYTTHKGQIAHDFIVLRPAHFLEMSARRVVRFWTGSGTRDGSILFEVHATLSLVLGGAGLVLPWQRRRRDIGLSMLIPLVVFPLPYYITHAEFRYRLVVDPILIALMAPALSWVWKQSGAMYDWILVQSSPRDSATDSRIDVAANLCAVEHEASSFMG